MDKACLLDWTSLQEVPMCTSDLRFRHSFADIDKKWSHHCYNVLIKLQFQFYFGDHGPVRNHILCVGPTVGNLF